MTPRSNLAGRHTPLLVLLQMAMLALVLALAGCGQDGSGAPGDTAAASSGSGGGSLGSDDHHSHLRYTQIFWRPLAGNSVEFVFQVAFRRNGRPCINPATLGPAPCTGPGGDAGVGDVVRDEIAGTRLEFGDGSNSGPLFFEVTSIDPVNNWLFGLGLDRNSLPTVDTTISHTYAAAGNVLARTDDCCRIGSLDAATNFHVNNPDGSYVVQTAVNVGTGNSSPQSGLPPIVFCPKNGLCTFFVPGTDPDGDALSFRLSTASEASSSPPGFDQPGPPDAPNAASIDPVTGLYTWDTTGATLAPSASANTLYSSQVTVEDPTSKVAVDFLIQLVDDIGDPPVFDSPPTPVCGTTLPATVGGALTFTVQGSDPDPGQVLTLNATGLPAGAVATPPLPNTGLAGQPVSSTISWTPTSTDVGTHVINFQVLDNFNKQALCTLTIDVTEGIVGEIDIKPGSDPNSINRNNRGVIPVAILGSADFDVLTIDVTTLAFGPGGATPAHTAGGHLEDVNGDGFMDLVSHYPTQDVALPDDATEACVTALTLGGVPFEGCDSVRIVK